MGVGDLVCFWGGKDAVDSCRCGYNFDSGGGGGPKDLIDAKRPDKREDALDERF